MSKNKVIYQNFNLFYTQKLEIEMANTVNGEWSGQKSVLYARIRNGKLVKP